MIRDTPPSDRERVFTAQIDAAGTLKLDAPSRWRAGLLAWARKRVLVTVAPASEARSRGQQGYWWGVVVPRVRAYHEGILGRVFADGEIHAMLCGNFVGIQEMPYGLPTYISSTTLDKAKTSKLIDEVRHYYLHASPPLFIPAPNEPDEEVL